MAQEIFDLKNLMIFKNFQLKILDIWSCDSSAKSDQLG